MDGGREDDAMLLAVAEDACPQGLAAVGHCCSPSLPAVGRDAATDHRGAGRISLLMASMGWLQAPTDGEHRLAARWAKAGRSCSCPRGLSSLVRPLLLGCMQASRCLHGFDARMGLVACLE
ncbi:hypothetical protein Dimus_030129 [Dionaea muscipula]